MLKDVMGFGWFVRRSADPQRLIKFYRDVVGFPLLRGYGETSAMHWAGNKISFEPNLGGQPQPHYTDRSQAPNFFIIRVKDRNAEVERLKKEGVEFINHMEWDHPLSYFLDPDGNVIGVVQRNRNSDREADREAWRRLDAGENTLPGVPPLGEGIIDLGYVVVRCTDFNKTLAFYTDVLDFPIVSRSDTPVALLSVGDDQLMEIALGAEPQKIVSNRTEANNAILFRTFNLDSVMEHMAKHNVPIVNEPFPIPDGRLAYFADPEGHVIGFNERYASSQRIEDIEARKQWESQSH